jgi:flagellar biosynthesis/type III secretory pathway protein FliH
MNKTKHKTPSRERYEKKYPVWSVRMPQEYIKDMELYIRETGLSRREFMSISLGKQKADYIKIRQEAFEEGKKYGIEIGKELGYKKAEKKYKIKYYCSVCEGDITMEPNSDSHNALIKYMFIYRQSHSQCAKKINSY